MPAPITSAARKSTIVRALKHRPTCPYFGRVTAQASHAETLRDRPPALRETRIVVMPRPDRPAHRSSLLERLMVPLLAAIVVGYAVAVIIRVMVAYGT